jgi:hypothetical protein
VPVTQLMYVVWPLIVVGVALWIMLYWNGVRRLRKVVQVDFSGMRYVHQGNGIIGPSIPFDNNWDELTQLRWHAAVSNSQMSDIVIDVQPAAPETRWRAHYQVSVTSNSDSRMNIAGPFSYDRAWTYITGVTTGVAMIRDLSRESGKIKLI